MAARLAPTGLLGLVLVGLSTVPAEAGTGVSLEATPSAAAWEARLTVHAVATFGPLVAPEDAAVRVRLERPEDGLLHVLIDGRGGRLAERGFAIEDPAMAEVEAWLFLRATVLRALELPEPPAGAAPESGPAEATGPPVVSSRPKAAPLGLEVPEAQLGGPETGASGAEAETATAAPELAVDDGRDGPSSGRSEDPSEDGSAPFASVAEITGTTAVDLERAAPGSEQVSVYVLPTAELGETTGVLPGLLVGTRRPIASSLVAGVEVGHVEAPFGVGGELARTSAVAVLAWRPDDEGRLSLGLSLGVEIQLARHGGESELFGALRAGIDASLRQPLFDVGRHELALLGRLGLSAGLPRHDFVVDGAPVGGGVARTSLGVGLEWRWR
jgi:hypothetical protein